EEQPVWFVATAPSGPQGHVNVSPKGGDGFRVLGPNEVAYLDLTGSGAETIAHLRDNGRLTIMFCSFGAKPLILRLYGVGEAVLPGHADFEALIGRFPQTPGTRSVIRMAVDRVSTSCGYAVPRMELLEPRSTLDEWAGRKTEDELDQYRALKN